MSEIRNRIIKILEESKISFMEDIEAQPDLFGGEDTYYKDGKKAVGFMDVLNFMSEIAPDLDYTGDKQSKDLYWMIYEPATPGINKIDSNKVADIESKLAKRFGENTVTVKLANSQYAPEIKKIYIGFVDVADVEDDGMEEATGLLKKGQRVRIKDTAENFPGEEGIIVNRRYTNLSNTPFYTVQMDNGQPYDVLADQVEPADLEEGWKDNLKKGVATLGVAGALAGNAMAHDSMYDGATRPFDDRNITVQQAQELDDEEDKATYLPNGMIQDQYGNEWTQEDWDKLMRGEDPFADNDDVHEAVDETNNVKNKELLDLLTRGTINVLNDDAIELKIDEVSGLLSDCYEVEVYDFSKSKEPVWHGWVDHNLIANISNGEPLFDDFHGED